MKQHRDNILVNDNLSKIRKAAINESENLMPHIIEAVRSYATEGEICGVLREIFGEYKENIIL
jgi:methylmalonyl-CoA mutase N-terminal domain/subunit